MTLSERGDEDIVEAVVVVITDGHAHSEKLNCKPGLRGHVRECSVVIIVIERRMRHRPMMLRPVRAIYEKKILPAVAIVIDERDARPHRLGKVFFPKSSIIVREMNSRRSRDVFELDRGSGRRGKTWRGRRKERSSGQRSTEPQTDCARGPKIVWTSIRSPVRSNYRWRSRAAQFLR